MLGQKIEWMRANLLVCVEAVAGGRPGKLAANIPVIEDVINAKITNHVKWTAIMTPKSDPSRNVFVGPVQTSVSPGAK